MFSLKQKEFPEFSLLNFNLMSIKKQIIDQKPRSEWRLIITTDNSKVVPYLHYQIQQRNKFLWWEWWVGQRWFNGIEGHFPLLNEDHSIATTYVESENKKTIDRAKHSLKVLRNEVVRYCSNVLDQRD